MNDFISEPIWDIAHLAHVEMLTPKLDEITRFFTDIMGMSISNVGVIRSIYALMTTTNTTP